MTRKIVQVAGFSNSGKTTLVEKLVSVLTNDQFRVATIKHHGHGGELTELDVGKDSWKHRQAGAVVSTAVSNGNLQLTVSKETYWQPEEILAIYEHLPIDIIVIEGFKKSPYNKIVLIKNETDKKLISTLENIFCVISWIPLDSDLQKLAIPTFQLEDEKAYIRFITQMLKGQDYE